MNVPSHRAPMALLAALLLMSTAVHAQKTDAQDLPARFAAADKDGDGKLTLEEAKAGLPRVAKGFSRIDKEKKGFVTLEQIQSVVAANGK